MNGAYRLEEVRTTFDRTTDSQAVIYFEWEGAPGVYRMAGRWQGPTGVSTMSEFEYRAQDRRFSAYWTLPLAATTPVGRWTITALVDGLPAGSFDIDITEGRTVAPPPRRPPLSQAQLYERLSAVFATIERGGAKTALFGNGAGTLLPTGGLATAFVSIDAAPQLAVVLPDGTRLPLERVRVWNRLQDWAIVPVAATLAAPLPIAAEAPQIGDRCYSVLGGPGGQSLTEGAVIGRAAPTGGGTRLLFEFTASAPATGAPVVNQDGELVGLVGGGLTPVTSYMELLAARGLLRGVPVVPIALVRDDPAALGATLAELLQQRVLIAPVVGAEHVVSGGFAASVQRSPLRPIDQRERFSVSDQKLVAFVSWDPRVRLRGMAQLRVYNAENAPVVESKPGKTDLKPGNLTFSYWEVPVPSAEGTYRAEVLLDGRVMWRDTFRVTR